MSKNDFKKNRKIECWLVILGLFLMTASLSWAGEKSPVKAGPKDKCPVCGMFVAKYPDWVAEIIYKDGSVAFFDGVKDMMKYYFNMKRYNPRKTPADIDSIYVTDYYKLEFIDGFKAFYVLGSDIYGPMGKELIPFEKRAAAQEFMKDHKGRMILTFEEITLPVINKDLD